jgi:multicopper oxidase
MGGWMRDGEARSGWSRRSLLRLGGWSLAAAAGAPMTPSRGSGGSVMAASAEKAPAIPYVPRPSTTPYVFKVERTELNPDGRKVVPAIAINGRMPAPEIRVREGEILRVQVENHLPKQPTSIHWHGLVVPAVMDGVPDVSTAPIAPAQAFIAEFPIRQSGTYWYHSHFDLQEQLGVSGAFIIEPRHEPVRYDRDYVVLLTDWLHANPEEALAKLRSGEAMKGMSGMATAPPPGPMAASKPDLSDLQYDAFLLNGRGNQDPWTCVAKRGDRVRFRLINGGSSTYFRFMIDGHALRITHADGPAVRPVEVDHLLIGMGECYDAIVTVRSSGSFTIRGVAQDGSGQAIGVLHTTDVPAAPDLSMPRFGPRALSYADLVALEPSTLPQGPAREFTLEATGNMAKYVWSINDQVYPNAEPLVIRQGDRVRVVLTNKTNMWHPFHLHGHFFRLLAPATESPRAPLKHTANLAPGGVLRLEFIADNPGRWFFHCHNSYHLEAGMARVISYAV